MSAEDHESKEEERAAPSELRRPKAPHITSALSRGVTARFGTDGLVVPRITALDIRDQTHEPRPTVLEALDLKKRTILKSNQVEEAGETGETGASSTSEPPPDMGQTLPLPQALRAIAQASGALGSPAHHEFDHELRAVEPAHAGQAPSYVAQASASAFAHAPTDAVPRKAPSDEHHIGQYEIIRRLGEGGMGVVYLARDSRLGRRVAIKVLRTQDKELTRRFIIEARTTARCTHENIVIIHEAGEHRGSPFMVLEYLEGKSLSDYQSLDPPSIPHAVEIMVAVVRALVRAHEEGIVHRDLKPDNIFITESGTVKVLDFGIAKLLHTDGPVSHAGYQGRAAPDAVSASTRGSNTGIAGTVRYMSPEQWLTPGDVDHRADIWAVGCTLFELITGRNPVDHLNDPLAVASYLASSEPMPTVLSHGAQVPKPLSDVISRCLEKDRNNRYADARSLLKALEPFLPGRRQALDEQLELGPFAGLRAFQEEDAGRFFGRTRELGTVLSRLRETPLMATVGPSGVGKSSFLRAGLIPALKNAGAGWEVLVCRPGRSPLVSLVEHLRPLLHSKSPDKLQSISPTASDEQIAERLSVEPGFLGVLLRERCRQTQGRLLLFLDQFEELYTLGSTQEERLAFTRALLGAADDAVSPVRVMLSVRADFLGRTTEDPQFVTALTKGLFFLGPPSEEGLREALVRPLEMVGYRFESSAIVEEMIRFLDGTPNGLPLLQFTAAQLWEARDPQNRVLTKQSYRGMGGVEGALVSHADRVYNRLPSDLQVLCRTLFMHLVTQERTRAIRTMKELADLSSEERSLKSLVEQLVESRLWVVTTQDGEPSVEVVHESLIANWPSLRRWLDESHEDSVFIDQLLTAAQQWAAKNRDVGLLWRGEMVAELVHFQRRFRGKLPELVAQFAFEVTQQERRAARVRRSLQVGGVLALAACLLAASVGLYVVNQERQKADQSAAVAKNSAKIAEQRLENQIRAEQERQQADEQRRKAEAARKLAQTKTHQLEDKVKLNAEEIAAKNLELEGALEVAHRQKRAAVTSAEEAREAKLRAEAAARELAVLLDRERARSERLNAQIGTLVEDL